MLASASFTAALEVAEDHETITLANHKGSTENLLRDRRYDRCLHPRAWLLPARLPSADTCIVSMIEGLKTSSRLARTVSNRSNPQNGPHCSVHAGERQECVDHSNTARMQINVGVELEVLSPF
jgi:hypothetical protein